MFFDGLFLDGTFFDDTRTALFTLLCQPIAIAAAVVLAGLNAAVWLLVFRRTGFPTALASLLIFPPFMLVLPLYFALAHLPVQRPARLPARPWQAKPLPARPAGPARQVDPAALYGFDLHRPVRLAADGLPRFRIALPPSSTPTDFLVRSELGPPFASP